MDKALIFRRAGKLDRRTAFSRGALHSCTLGLKKGQWQRLGQDYSDHVQRGSQSKRATVLEKSEWIPESESRKKSKSDGGTLINLTFLPLGNLNFQKDSCSETGREEILENLKREMIKGFVQGVTSLAGSTNPQIKVVLSGFQGGMCVCVCFN